MLTKLIGTIALLFLFTACGSSDETAPATDNKPEKAALVTEVEEDGGVKAAGTWNFTEGEFFSVATIANGNVSVVFGNANSKTVYWVGSFDAETLQDGDEIVSQADKAAANTQAIISDAETLTFRYDDGVLMYDFSMMGRSKPVGLEK